MTIRQAILPMVCALFAPGTFQPGLCQSLQLASEPGYVIRNWDIEEGLPDSHVAAVASTPDGRLWIGTSSGLVVYDGFSFKTCFAETAAAGGGGGVTALMTDRSGTLWIGTATGTLVQRDTQAFRLVGNPPAGMASPVISLVEDGDGTIWGAWERKGLFSYRAGNLAAHGTNSGLGSTMVWGVILDAHNRLWAVSKWRLATLERGRWCSPPGLPAGFPRVSAIGAAREGGLWIACVAESGPAGDRGTRIFRYANGVVSEETKLPWPQDSRRALARFLMEDQKGRVWMTTRGAGIFLRENGAWKWFSETPALSQSHATCIAQDEDLNLWLGLQGGGLFQLRPRVVVAREPGPTMPTSCFWTVAPARDGSVWGGTDGNGIFRWRGDEITHYQARDGLSNPHVNALLEDSRGRLWAGTMDGLFSLQGDRFERVEVPDAIRQPVFALKEDRSGTLWIGTRNGLVQLGLGVTNVFRQDQGIPFGPINAIEQDVTGRMWIAVPPYRDWRSAGPVGSFGLFAQAGPHFEHVGEGRWAGESNIRSLCADASGNLWIGTIGTGFYRYRDGTFTEFNWEDGVPHNRIQSILPDESGNLWFLSEAGVFGCPIRQLENYRRGDDARLDWWRVNRADGLPNKSATGNGQPCAAPDAEGRVWFANGHVIAKLDPAAVTRASRIRPPQVQEVWVNGVVQAMPENGILQVASGIRRVEIHYGSPNTTAPELATYWIRLKGFDREWVNAGKNRVVSYNLQPGDYQFSVAAISPDGTRLEVESPLRVRVNPSFWERSSVRALAGLVVVAGITFGVWRWEQARSGRRVRQLELQRAMDQVRQRIARDIHDDLGSGLTEITLLSDNLRMDLDGRSAGAEVVERIAARARALTHEMDEVVWAINPQTDTLESLVTYLNEFAQERLALAGIRCRLETAPDLPERELSAEMRHSLYRAAKEALNNAIRHSNATEVTVTIEARENELLFAIRDNGRGFDPGRQLKRGNGLRNMRQRLEEIGGAYQIFSTSGHGTTVTLVVPFGRIGSYSSNRDKTVSHAT